MRHDVRQLKKNPRISSDPRKLRSENLTQYYLCKEIFLRFSTLKDIIQAQNKTKH